MFSRHSTDILTSSDQDIMLSILFEMLFGWVIEFVIALLQYNCFDYFFQALLVNVNI